MPHLGLTLLVVSLIGPVVASGADGGVYVYLQPLPQEASRLAFSVASVSAVSQNGTEYPLKVTLGTVRPGEAARQRLLAAGRVPIGSYAGFTFKIKQAGLKEGRSETTLTVPELPVRLDAKFIAAAQQGLVVWLALKYQESLTNGSAFSPVFSVITPPRPLVEHTGFVTNSGSSTITLFDKDLGQAVAVLETCAGPSGMALDQRRRRMYVACTNEDEIQSVDVATGEVIDRSRLSPGDRPRELALTPDGLTLLSVNAGSNSVSFFDASSLARHERLNVEGGPGAIVVAPGGRRAFVFNTLSSSISVIDLAKRTTLATLATEAAPLRGQFNNRGDRLYVIHDRSPYMTVLDPQQMTTVTRARLRIGVDAIAVDTLRDLVCIGGENDTAVEFYDPHALMPLYSMRVNSGVSYMAFDSEDNTLYMVSPRTRSVAVARLADRKVVSEIDVGDSPYSVVVMGEK